MSDLDQALEAYLEDEEEQGRYYQMVLRSDFYIPLHSADPRTVEPETVRPLVVEAEGKPYMLLFDSEERLNAWARQATPFVVLAGFAAAAISPPELHWAVNLGSGFAKEFVPEEIGWLKDLPAE